MYYIFICRVSIYEYVDLFEEVLCWKALTPKKDMLNDGNDTYLKFKATNKKLKKKEYTLYTTV